jgi:hypothetical protein
VSPRRFTALLAAVVTLVAAALVGVVSSTKASSGDSTPGTAAATGVRDLSLPTVPAEAITSLGLHFTPPTTHAAISLARAGAVASGELGGGRAVREAMLAWVTLDGPELTPPVRGLYWVVSVSTEGLMTHGLPATLGSAGAMPRRETWALVLVDAQTGAFVRAWSGD